VQSPGEVGGHPRRPACAGQDKALRFGLVRDGDSKEHEKDWLEIADIRLWLIKTAADIMNGTCRSESKASWW